MKTRLKIFSFVLLLSACFTVQAQNSDNDAKIQAIASNWEVAWNKHDMKALSALFTDDADFVNVGARHWKGRKEIEEQHASRLNQFNESVWKTKKATIQYLKPDIALVHVEWSMKGDKDPDGTRRQPRDGVFTWVVVLKANSKWLIRAAQNTNVGNLQQLNVPKQK